MPRQTTTRKKRTSKKATPQKARRGMYRGAGAIEKAQQEQEEVERRREQRRAQASGPMRLYLKQKSSREVVIVDEAPDFFMFEHQIYNHGKPGLPKYSYTGCVKEYETCPACQQHGDSSFNLYLTVIDLAEYTNAKNEVVEFSKKLMVVKSGSQRKFIRRHAKNGSLRGQVVNLTRDGDKDPVIGNDIEWDDKIDEEELTGAYIREWTDREGKKHVENCGEVYDYEEIFQEPSVENILEQLDGEVEAPAGSREQARAELDSEEEEEEEGEDGWEGDEAQDAPFDPDEEEEEEGEGEEEGEEEEEEAPKRPPRRTSKASAKKAPTRSAGRKARRRL